MASKVHPSVHSLPPTRASSAGFVHGPLLHAGPRGRLDRGGYRPVASVPMAIKRVGIVGSGIMGSGIAEVAAAAGYEVVVRSRSQDRRRRHGGGARAARWPSRWRKGKRTEAEAAEIAGRVSATTAPGRAGRRRPGDRVGRRGPGREEGAVRRARPRLQAGGHPRHQHLDLAGGRDGHGHRPARAGLRHPLLQPGAGHGAGGGGAAHHRRRCHRGGRPASSPVPAARSRSR